MRFPLPRVLPLLVLALTVPSDTPAQENAPAAPRPAQAAPPPSPREKGAARTSETAPRWAYVVSNNPNMGSFYLDGEKGLALFTTAIQDDGTKVYQMARADLEFVGSDGSGHYWHYRIPLPGGLNWYFPKAVGGTSWVYSQIEAPGTHPVPFGTALRFPIR